MNWLYIIIPLILFIISLFFEEVRDFYEEIWTDYLLGGFEYIISFEWLSDLGEIFSAGWEAMTSIEDSPLTNVWFWAFYIALMASVWYLPSKFGMLDYTLPEKFLYSALFFIVDWFIIAHFQNS
jgi:hypothetical protein